VKEAYATEADGKQETRKQQTLLLFNH